MRSRSPTARVLTTCFVFGAIGACGGGIVIGGSNAGDDGGMTGTGTGSGSGIVIGSGTSGGGCVDVSLADLATSCAQDDDCSIVTIGTLCNGSCACGNAAVNGSGLLQYDQETSGLVLGECPCAFPGTPTCVDGRCTLGGIAVTDGGRESDVELGPDAFGNDASGEDGGFIEGGGPDGEFPLDGPADVTGGWHGNWTTDGGLSGTMTMNLSQTGSSVFGAVDYMDAEPCFDMASLSGTLSGHDLTGTVTEQNAAMTVQIEFMGTALVGKFDVTSGACSGVTGSFTATD